MKILKVASLVLLLDQLTKLLVQRTMLPGESIPLWPGIVHLTYVQNPGAAFGLLPYRTGFFVLVTIIVVVLTMFFYRRLGDGYSLLRWGLSLQLGGALGNLIDRIRLSSVTDFIDLRVWPVFNLADMSIVSGVILLAWELLRYQPRAGDQEG